MTITKAKSLKGEITVPGDKSISHRGVMFGAISEGITELTGFLDGADCRSTIGCFKAMGIDERYIPVTDNKYEIAYKAVIDELKTENCDL